MQVITRRGVLACAATLAVAARPGKSGATEHLQNFAAALTPAARPAPPPAFRFHDADGRPHDLAEFAGHGVLINLWATWCAPCVAELPSLDRLAAALAPQGIVVLALSSDRGGAATVRSFYADHGIKTLGLWLDPDSAAIHALQVRGLPTTLLIDRTGREQARLEGGVDWSGPTVAAAVQTTVARGA